MTFNLMCIVSVVLWSGYLSTTLYLEILRRSPRNKIRLVYTTRIKHNCTGLCTRSIINLLLLLFISYSRYNKT